MNICAPKRNFFDSDLVSSKYPIIVTSMNADIYIISLLFKRELLSRPARTVKEIIPTSIAMPPDDIILFLCIPLSVGTDIDIGYLINI
jgi:hypothetical protein